MGFYQFGLDRFKFDTSSGSANEESKSVHVNGWQDINVQVWGTFAATVTLQGRVHEDADWAPLHVWSSAGSVFPVSGSFTDLRLVITNWASGQVFGGVKGIDIESLLRRDG